MDIRKEGLRVLVILLCMGISGLFLQGCSNRTTIHVSKVGAMDKKPGHGPPPWAPAHGYRAKYMYLYYPDIQVYWDVSRHLYFFQENGRWTASVSLPSSLVIKNQYSVELEMDLDRPYLFHADVVRRYPPGQAKKFNKPFRKKKW